jgi:hypothetical protein
MILSIDDDKIITEVNNIPSISSQYNDTVIIQPGFQFAKNGKKNKVS